MHAQKIPFIYLTIRKNVCSKLSNGMILHAVYLAISHKRKVRYYNSGVKISRENFVKGKIVNHPAAAEINLKLQEMIQKLYEFIYMNNLFDFFPQEILDKYYRKQDTATSFIIYAQQIANNMLRSGKYSTGTSLHTMLKALEKIDVKLSSFNDITCQKLEIISNKWTEKGLKENSQGIYFRNIRLIYNRAVLEGIASREKYPFHHFRIPRKKTAKRNLSVDEMKKLISIDLVPGKAAIRDLFILSFLLIGINYKDLLTATKGQLCADRLVYNRAKTGKLISIKVEPEAAVLIERYKGRYLLLNFLEQAIVNEKRKHPAFADIIQKSNILLKDIAKICGINHYLSTYYARHSWATIAARNGVSRDVIGLALGHASTSVTDSYIEWDPALIDQANQRVIRLVFSQH